MGNPNQFDWGGEDLVVKSITFSDTPGGAQTALSSGEVSVLDGVTAGTAAASKAVVLDSGTKISGIKNITLAAGTATVAPLVFTSGTNLTTAAAGAFEFDGTAFYATPAASQRHLSDMEMYQCLTADYTLTSTATAQKAFNATTNGAVTVPGSTGYFIDWQMAGTNTGTTSHTWGILLAGTATITAAGTMLFAQAYTQTGNALTAVSGIYIVGAGVSASTAVTAASTSATENVVIKVWGRVNINATGTLIPQVKFSADPIGVEKILSGSYFRMTPIGAGTVTSVGNWS